jgi:hypothetical protein
MLPDYLTQTSPDAIAQDRAADPAGSNKPGAETVVRFTGEHAQHQQLAALSAAGFPDQLELRTSR